MTLAELFLRKQVRLVSASAYVEPNLPLVYFRAKGAHRAPDGRIVCPNEIVGKVSRVEVARKFFSAAGGQTPHPPGELGRLSSEEAELAASVSPGGGPDGRSRLRRAHRQPSGHHPAADDARLRDELAAAHAYDRPPCVGLGGGIATPEAAAAAFALGAAYVLTGSINQCCIEAGTSQAVCTMLAEAEQADVAMAPAADMFELG